MNDYYLSSVWHDVIEYVLARRVFGDKSTIKLIEEKCYVSSITEDEVSIVCTYFIALVILQQSLSTFEEAFTAVLHYPVKVVLIKEEELKETIERVKANAKGQSHGGLDKYLEGVRDLPSTKKTNIDTIDTTPSVYFHTKCDRAFTFDNFVVGRSNVQSQVSALACATNPGLAYNPLFIYGRSGLGKTHLLNAIGNKVNQTLPNFKVGFISGLDFVEGVAKSIKEKTIENFKKEFYKLDVLLVDDIQFIAGKEKTHEIFFSVFNELVNNKKQVVLTCDRLPQEIDGLEERIISRFNQGLNVNISSPEYETAINILKKKLTLNSAQSIDDEVLSYIATNFSEDVRQLEGALNRLLFYVINFSQTNHVTIDIAKEAFRGQVSENDEEMDVNKIKKAVCNYYGITRQQLNSKIRTKNIAIPRQIAMYLTRKYLDMPYKEIGNNFGKRDHSTVINACEKVEDSIKKDVFYQKAIKDIEALLK